MKVAIFQFAIFGINSYVVYDVFHAEFVPVDKIHNGIFFLTVGHAVGNEFLKDKYNVPVLAHELDRPLGERMLLQAQMFGLPERFKNVEISEYLHDGEIIKIGNGELKVICVPGHSQGSVALYDEKDNFVIVGDALFSGSIGRTDLPGGDYDQLISSIRSRLLTLPPQTIVYPGHGPHTTIAQERQHNPYLNN